MIYPVFPVSKSFLYFALNHVTIDLEKSFQVDNCDNIIRTSNLPHKRKSLCGNQIANRLDTHEACATGSQTYERERNMLTTDIPMHSSNVTRSPKTVNGILILFVCNKSLTGSHHRYHPGIWRATQTNPITKPKVCSNYSLGGGGGSVYLIVQYINILLYTTVKYPQKSHSTRSTVNSHKAIWSHCLWIMLSRSQSFFAIKCVLYCNKWSRTSNAQYKILNV